MNVVITGMGILSSLGNNVSDMFNSLLAGKSGVRHYPEWQAQKGLYCHLGAPAEPYDIKVIPRSARRTMSRMSEMGILATMQALEQAQLLNSPLLTSTRSLLCMGSTSGSPFELEIYFRKYLERGGPEGQLSTSFFKVMNHSVAANVVAGIGKNIPIIGISSACSTSAQALIVGWEMIQSGLYDIVIAGGADELHHTSVAIFDNVHAASRGYNENPQKSPRPFDKARDGLVVSEGAGVLILESEKHAMERKAPILATFRAGAYICDATHMSEPQVQAMVHVMKSTFQRAGCESSHINYVNAHATATLMGDIAEAKATAEIFGSKTPVSSLKGHFGHSLAACGALEVIASIEMMNRGMLIPTRNLDNIDPGCNSINLLREITPTKIHTFMSNNFAFGGMNTSLIISKENRT